MGRTVSPDVDLTKRVIAAAFEVHDVVGTGMLESTYERSLCIELELRRIPFQRQILLSMHYKSVEIPDAYRLDLLIGRKVIVEIKAIESITAAHYAQVRTYLRHTGVELGLLINFNAMPFIKGIRRVEL
jgi:GxxExxY protein